jgi:2-keto-4-pentenoate hydratase/2-oxohepta-3-ene-1,7-dioic acid hydratase in catechol pathway
MRIALIDKTPALVDGNRMLDIRDASLGRFVTMRDVFDDWDAFSAWARGSRRGWREIPGTAVFGPPVPEPRQVFAVGLNYAEHRLEAADDYPIERDQLPLAFTKFPSSIVGAHDDVVLPSSRCDFEVELVVAMSRYADRVRSADAWDFVAGLTVGQDISDRSVQYADPPQLSLSKSFRTFSPIGPVLASLDEFADPLDLTLECRVNDELTQTARTSQMIHGVADLIEFFTSVTPLFPGDLIFTGTPMGVGHRQKPARFLQPGDVVTSRIEGIGEMRNGCVGAGAGWPYADRVLDDAAGAQRGW